MITFLMWGAVLCMVVNGGYLYQCIKDNDFMGIGLYAIGLMFSFGAICIGLVSLMRFL